MGWLSSRVHHPVYEKLHLPKTPDLSDLPSVSPPPHFNNVPIGIGSRENKRVLSLEKVLMRSLLLKGRDLFIQGKLNIAQ